MSAPFGEAERVAYRSPAFQAKLFHALAVIDVALAKARKPYVAISGGKDSLAVMALALMRAPDLSLLFGDEELIYPETVEHIGVLQELAGDQLRIITSASTHAGWFRSWHDKPYWRTPLPGTRYVKSGTEQYMRAQGYDLTLLGTRMGESHKRRDWLAAHGPTYTVAGGAETRCCPIYDWTTDDVWCLIAGMRLPYNAAYDRLQAIGISRERQRVGPLPLVPRETLANGWADLLAQLEARYGDRWQRER